MPSARWSPRVTLVMLAVSEVVVAVSPLEPEGDVGDAGEISEGDVAVSPLEPEGDVGDAGEISEGDVGGDVELDNGPATPAPIC